MKYNLVHFNSYQFYGSIFTLYTLDAVLFYQLNYKKFNFEFGISLPVLDKIVNVNTYQDQIPVRDIIYSYSNGSTAFLSISNFNDLAVQGINRVSLNLGVNYHLEKRIALTASVLENIFSKGSFQRTEISGYTLKEGFNNPNKIYTLNKIDFKKKLSLLNLGLRYYFDNYNN